jgi:dGTPase
LGELFVYLMANPHCVSSGYRDRLQEWPTHRVVCDYIAGMTDAYLLHVHQELLG